MANSDKLSDLPVPDNASTDQGDSEIIKKFFGSAPEETPKSRFSKIDKKTIGIATLLFVLLGNTYIDAMFAKLPKVGSSSMLIFILKAVLFAVALFLVLFFC